MFTAIANKYSEMSFSLLNETKIVLATFSINIATDHPLMRVTAVLNSDP